MTIGRLIVVVLVVLALAGLGAYLSGRVDPECLTTIMTLFLAVAAVSAIWKEQIQDWLIHPDLRIRAEFYHHETWREQLYPGVSERYRARAYYVACRVENRGAAPARNVEAAILSVVRRTPDGNCSPHKIMTPSNLSWSYRSDSTLEVLPRQTARGLTIGHLTQPTKGGEIGEPGVDGMSRFWLELNPVPYSMEHGLDAGAFTHEIRVQLSADNATPKVYLLRLHHTGRWTDDTAQLWPKDLKVSNEGESEPECRASTTYARRGSQRGALEEVRPMGRFDRLLNLFYGLALSTGFGFTAQKYIAGTLKPTADVVALLLFGVLLALCDWVIYYFAVSHHAYSGLGRLGLDLLFPVGLFLLGLSPSQPFLFISIAGLYFVGSAAYCRLAVRHGVDLPAHSSQVSLVAAALCLVAWICAGLPGPITWAYVLAFGVSALLWVGHWGRWLRLQLRRPRLG